MLKEITLSKTVEVEIKPVEKETGINTIQLEMLHVIYDKNAIHASVKVNDKHTTIVIAEAITGSTTIAQLEALVKAHFEGK